MIKIFKDQHEWSSKVNFVDQHNNLIGYDTFDDCCAHGFYFIAPELIRLGAEQHEENPTPDLTDYEFDTKFFHDQRDVDTNEHDNAVVFRMIALNKPDLYLHLYNSHNGYYSKGFETSFGEVKEGLV